MSPINFIKNDHIRTSRQNWSIGAHNIFISFSTGYSPIRKPYSTIFCIFAKIKIKFSKMTWKVDSSPPLLL